MFLFILLAHVIFIHVLCIRKLNKMKALKLTKELDINRIVYPAGSTLKVKSKGVEYYYILEINDIKVYSIWKRKNFIDFKCN